MRKLSIIVSIIFFAFSVFAQDDKPKVVGEVTVTAKYANVDPLYQEIRKESNNPNAFSGEYASVNNLVLQKDIGTFSLQSGDIYFLKADNGRYIGGVFLGNGVFSLTPVNDVEKNSVKIFTDTTEVKEPFTQLVMFFTDKTFDEIKSSPNAKMMTNGSSANRVKAVFQEKETLLKEKFRYNISSRTLSDFLSPARQGFF